jgi:hypothetical protein
MFDSPIVFLYALDVVLILAALVSIAVVWRRNARGAIVSIPELDQSQEGLAQAVMPAEPIQVKHAFDFADDSITMILEMPISALEDDDALAEAWVDTVSLARMAWLDVQQGHATLVDETAGMDATNLDESEITREHLESSLQRLHDSAERRRELRMKLAERRHNATGVAVQT